MSWATSKAPTHTSVSATRHGVSDDKMAAVYDYTTSPLFSEAERVALDFAMEVVETARQRKRDLDAGKPVDTEAPAS